MMRHRSYPQYKFSGVEWIGNIPSHWTIIRLKFVTSFIGGGTPSKDNLNYWSGDLPWVSPKDMKYPFLQDTEDHITEEAVMSSSTNIVEEGAVLIVVRSGILKHSIPVAINTCKVAMNQDMKALIPKSSLLPTYLAYFIRGNQNELLFEWRKEGTTVESIEFELLANTRMLLPPLAEQQTITTYLDYETSKINTLITKKQKLIELMQERRTALICHLTTKGQDSSVPMKKSGFDWIGSIPIHWEVRQLKWLVSYLSRGDSPEYAEESSIKVINQACIYWEGLRLANVKYQIETDISDWKGVLQPGDLLINSTGTGTLGRAATLNHIGKFIADSHVTIVRPLPELIDTTYLCYLIQTPLYQGYIYAALVAGSTNQIELSREGLRSLPIILPPLSEQQAISKFLDQQTARIRDLVTINQQTIDKLQEYRTALIALAITGKIDLSEQTKQYTWRI